MKYKHPLHTVKITYLLLTAGSVKQTLDMFLAF